MVSYKATTIATLRHFGRWLHKQRPLLAGDPLVHAKNMQTDAPELERPDPAPAHALKIRL